MTSLTSRGRRRVLPILAAMLIASSLIRAVLGASDAIAEEAAHPLPAEPAATGMCLPETDTGALIEAFRQREARVAERETALADRAQALHVAEAEISEKIEALVAAEASLAATLALAETAAEDDLSRLTLVYENMKPADAAALFETMDTAFAAGFLGRMAPEAAAAVMTDLAPETAYSISAMLAGRNALVPTE